MQIQLNSRETELLKAVAEAAAKIGVPAFAVGGFVRDKLLGRPTKDIDVVCIGDGMVLAQTFAKLFHPTPPVALFKTFGTAQVKFDDIEIEFVGARKESYARHSRKPEVSPGTIEDDQNRRDFTVNSLAIELSVSHFGHIIDPFGGLADLENKILKTPYNPRKLLMMILCV
jgi:tRNA nucleotidyltransferase/poly(A) polymerase